MRPISHGYLKLKSLDPYEHPVINLKYLSTERDRVVVVTEKVTDFRHRTAYYDLFTLSVFRLTIMTSTHKPRACQVTQPESYL